VKRSNTAAFAGVALVAVFALLGAFVVVGAGTGPATQCATPSQPSSASRAQSTTPSQPPFEVHAQSAIQPAEVEVVALETRREPVQRVTRIAPAHQQGAVLAGQVLTPDGLPAAFALVHAEPSSANSADVRGTARETMCDEDGRFRLRLLEQTPYSVSAARGSATFERPYWALLERVEPSEELVIVLQETHVARGCVLDDSGVPLPKFEVDAELISSSGAGEVVAASAARRSLRGGSPHGDFELRGLLPGEWSFRVRATGHDPAPPQLVTIPPDARGLSFRLVRMARLSGVTVDTAGKPLLDISLDASVVGVSESRHQLGISGYEGRFSQLLVSSGVVELVASGDGYELVAPLQLHLAPGEQRELRLVLVNR